LNTVKNIHPTLKSNSRGGKKGQRSEQTVVRRDRPRSETVTEISVGNRTVGKEFTSFFQKRKKKAR